MAIGKIISEKKLNRRGVLNILRGLWSIEVVPLTREIDKNLYSFSFANEKVKEKAIEEAPWSINRTMYDN
ncbi:hypothetical protein DITRI_Ditri20bG0072900 [Diplodiscus trichospermus]